MSARVVAGWVDIDDIVKPAAAEVEVEGEDSAASERDAVFADVGRAGGES